MSWRRGKRETALEAHRRQERRRRLRRRHGLDGPGLLLGDIVCSKCGVGPDVRQIDLHHVTYERNHIGLGGKQVPLCARCHATLHAVDRRVKRDDAWNTKHLREVSREHTGMR